MNLKLIFKEKKHELYLNLECIYVYIYVFVCAKIFEYRAL